VVQVIHPGDVNWMTAGRGVVHAEHLPPERGPLSGIQLWVALPRALEECEPAFVHYPRASLPVLDDGRARIRLLAGTAWGASSPVKTGSPLFYAEVLLEAGASLPVPVDFLERGAYLVKGSVALGAAAFTEGQLAVLAPGVPVVLRALTPSRLLVFGGEPLDGPRHINWNFVSSSRERLEQARADWRAHRFARVPGEERFIPLPGDGAGPQRYPEGPR
jgi:redox-sensitive bicupin YhaK (pirin superfamily)